MEVGVLVVQPLEMVALTFPLMDKFFCWHLTMLWNSSKSCKKITKGLRHKSYEACRNFNISHMKACKRHMHI
jgi:hypothetical protein